MVDSLQGLIALEGPLPPGAEEQLTAIERRLQGQSAVYLSTPITTGLRFLQWRRSADGIDPEHSSYGHRLKLEVMDENRRALVPLKQRTASHFPNKPLIDPTDLTVEGWRQFEYHRFWVEVLERYASAVVFADGWHYSTGCSIEFAAACVLGLPVYDADLEPLDVRRGSEMIANGSKVVAEAGLDSGPLLAAANFVSTQWSA